MNMYKIRMLFPLLISAAALFAFRVDDGRLDSRVMKAAGAGLGSFLSNIPQGSEAQFGFASRDEIAAATVSTPYRTLALTSDFYALRSLDGINGTKFISLTNEWRVPVVVNGENRLLLTVVAEGDNVVASDLGGAGLAKEIGRMVNPASGHSYGILRVYRLSSDFLVDMPGGTLDNARYFPLTSARMSMPSLAGANGYKLSEILPVIKNEIKNHPVN